MTNFTASSRWQDWIDHCRTIDRRRADFDSNEENCPITRWGRSLGDISIEEAITPGRGEALEGRDAFLWFLMHTYLDLPVPMRSIVVDSVVANQHHAAVAWLKGVGIPEDVRRELLAACQHLPVVQFKLQKIERQEQT